MLIQTGANEWVDTATGMFTNNGPAVNAQGYQISPLDSGPLTPHLPISPLDGIGPLTPQIPTPYVVAAAISPTAPARPSIVQLPSGGSQMGIQDIEAQIPGIGMALVKLTQGWDNLNVVEKGLILAAVALVGAEALGALGAALGAGGLLGVLRSLPVIGVLTKGIFGGGTAAAHGQVPAGFSPAWKANGVQFYRNPNGLLGVMNHKGRWKQWRPRKPIVLYANGAKNLKTMLKADKALKKQAKELSNMIERRSGTRKAPEKRIPMTEAVRMVEAASRSR